MSLNNLISVEFTEKELTDLNAAMDTIAAIIAPKVINLTPEERTLYGRIGTKLEGWLDRVKGHMDVNPQLLPNFLDKNELIRIMLRARHCTLY